MKNLHNALRLKQLYQLRNLGYRYASITPYSPPQEAPLHDAKDLTTLAQHLHMCHLCTLSKSRQRVLIGEGKSRSDILFVGEIANKKEEEEGKIFIGRSGEMLTHMIEKVLGIPRKEVYLTHLLKCHPPETSKIEDSMMQTCSSYLLQEIKLVQPKIVVTLGQLSYRYLTQDATPLQEIRGRTIRMKDYQLVPTYHPNFLLKNPSRKQEVFEDLKMIKSLLSS